MNREKDKLNPCRGSFEKMVEFFASDPDARVIVTDNFWDIP